MASKARWKQSCGYCARGIVRGETVVHTERGFAHKHCASQTPRTESRRLGYAKRKAAQARKVSRG